MELDKRIKTFVELGKFLKQFNGSQKTESNFYLNDLFYNEFEVTIQNARIYNAWFTSENILNAINSIANNLTEQKLIDWISIYVNKINANKLPKTIAVIMAGNIPLVAFNDFLCVLISGNKILAKLSSNDNVLLPFISKIIFAIEPEFKKHITFENGKLNNMDAVIATGSNNSSRYFEYYFGKYPHIIRKNRNSIAVLSGTETSEELTLLGKDIFQYFGMGCRNVSKIFVPLNYSFNLFYESIFEFQNIINNNKYANNYEYNRTIYLMKNDKSLLDNNFLLLKEDTACSSPVGVLYFEYYDTLETLNQTLTEEKNKFQCIVSNSNKINNAIEFGKTQCPTLIDYADGIDVIDFLINLN